MEKVQVKSFNVSGLKTRTNNKIEMNSETSKIAKLWDNFYSNDILSKKKDSDNIFGVYFNYESDMNGDFDVLAGINSDVDIKYENIAIQSGEYLVFKNKGEMPKIVIDTWIDIWNYFNSNLKIQRAYKTDFEKYLNSSEIEIYIGIK